MLKPIDVCPRLHVAPAGAPPRILLLVGSCRDASKSRRLAREAADVLIGLGAEIELFDPRGLPLEGNECNANPKLEQLHRLVPWSDGQVWCSPEHHGTMSGVMKLVLDCFPCDERGRTLAKGKALSLMQVAGGAMATGALQDMQRVSRSLGMFLTSRQVSVGEAGRAFDSDGRLQRADLCQRLEEAMGELIKFSVLMRENTGWLAAPVEPIATATA